jgi:hypothetical protein
MATYRFKLSDFLCDVSIPHIFISDDSSPNRYHAEVKNESASFETPRSMDNQHKKTFSLKRTLLKNNTQGRITSSLRDSNSNTPSSKSGTPSSRRQDDQEFCYSSDDDCSLGSLGDRNEVSQGFFLQVPQKKDSANENETSNGHQVRRDQDRLDIRKQQSASLQPRRQSSSLSRQKFSYRGTFLKPRTSKEDLRSS